MRIELDIETYCNTNGEKKVYLTHNGSSGYEAIYNTVEELQDIIADYIYEVVDYAIIDEEEEN